MQHSINPFLIRWENYVYNFYFFVSVSSGCIYIILHLQSLFFFFLTQRREFINGEAEPTDAESEWHSENEDEEKLTVSVSWVIYYGYVRLSELNYCSCH